MGRWRPKEEKERAPNISLPTANDRGPMWHGGACASSLRSLQLRRCTTRGMRDDEGGGSGFFWPLEREWLGGNLQIWKRRWGGSGKAPIGDALTKMNTIQALLPLAANLGCPFKWFLKSKIFFYIDISKEGT